MGLGTLAVILLLLISIWWLLRARRARLNEAAGLALQRRTKKTAYHAVSIRFQPDACNAAKAMAGRRFLATAPPKLPLPDCDATKCRCRFAHHDDRRSGKDRRSPFSPTQTMTGSGSYLEEQRNGGDRRRKDVD